MPVFRPAQILSAGILFSLSSTTFPSRAGEAPAGARENLPPFQVIPAAKPEELTKSNGWPASGNRANWERSLGGSTSNRFSDLRQITPQNVSQLEVAWTYHSGDGTANIQCNPIVVDGTLYTSTPGNCIVAIDAATGQERWRFDPSTLIGKSFSVPAKRGLLYWRGDAENGPRLLFGDGNWLLAVDPKNGQPIPTFGEGGKAAFPAGAAGVGATQQRVLDQRAARLSGGDLAVVAGAMHQHVWVIAGFSRDVFGFDARTGKQLWRFATQPRRGEFGHDTWSNVTGGANCWGGLALDESRGIAFVATGSPKPNFFGMDHLGDNLFANCVIALDALTGKRLWHFQELRHDIWDWDIPAPPNLVTVERHGIRVDAVAQVTKLGNTLLLDRVTGKPLYDFRLVRVDTHGLPGDQTAPYQPLPELPQPFARNAYTEADLPTLPGAKEALLPTFQRANTGPFPSLDEARPTLMFNVHGGAEWTGAAADSRGFLYVTSNEIPWNITCFRDDDPAPANPPTAGHQVYQSVCIACHGPELRGIGHAPPLKGLRHRMKDEEFRAVLKNGRNGMPALPFLSDSQVRNLADFIFCRDRPATPPTGKPSWTFSGFAKLTDPQGYPACSPPWGTLNCINLHTGKKMWSVPLGEYDALKAAGVPITGQENFGGAAVTASGLVFASGTRDKKIRAFDADSGRELWSHVLPFHGTAPPSIYEVAGRQYVVIPATGGGKLGGPTGDTWVAFALPMKL